LQIEALNRGDKCKFLFLLKKSTPLLYELEKKLKEGKKFNLNMFLKKMECVQIQKTKSFFFNRFVKINTRGGDHDESKPGFFSLKKFFISAVVLKQNKNCSD